MTKRELVEALKAFPDDMDIVLTEMSHYDEWSVQDIGPPEARKILQWRRGDRLDIEENWVWPDNIYAQRDDYTELNPTRFKTAIVLQKGTRKQRPWRT